MHDEPQEHVEEKKPNPSTGPRSEAGKATSSMNRLTHGLRSEKTILPDEDPTEYDAGVQAWLDIYQPRDRKEDELVNEIIHAHWHLKRCRKRLEEVEFALPGRAANWTDEHQKRYSNFTRYHTTAERSFNRWYREMETHRRHQFREEQISEKARLAAAQVDRQCSTKQELPAPAPPVKVTQVIEIEVEDGETITICYPDNHVFLDYYKNLPAPPVFMERLLIFLDGVPPEYIWANPKQRKGSQYPEAVQKMPWNEWLEVIAREEAEGAQHIGPVVSNPR